MKDLDIEGVKRVLNLCKHSDIPSLLDIFTDHLKEFIDQNNRLPVLPQDSEHFKDFPKDHLTYLIESCRKFRFIEHPPPSPYVLEAECDSGVLAEFKAAALLAAEIQKIITRKYIPEQGIFLFQNGKQSDMSAMPTTSEPADKKKLEANYAVYVKVAEREFLAKNFKSALKSFKNAHEIAMKLKRVEDMIKTLDTQSSCHEQLGNLDEATNIASQLISTHRTSPIGYLRMGKLLRLKKQLEKAENCYKKGLQRASKKDPLYEVLVKQLKTVQAAISTVKEASKQPSIEDGKNQIYGKGHLLSMSPYILNQICSRLNRSTLKTFASTCNYTHDLTLRGLFTGSFGLSNLSPLNNSQLFPKFMIEYSTLSNFSQSAIFSVNSEASTLSFLTFLKNNMAKILMAPRIANLSMGSMGSKALIDFSECLNRGFRTSIVRLRIDLSESGIPSGINFRYLKELVIVNNNAFSSDPNIEAPNLESLTVTGERGIRTFANNKHLVHLIYPNEADFNAFNSEKIVLASLRYETCATMRPRPIQYLCLNGSSSNNNNFSCIDLTQYTYESIKVLHLDGLTLNTSASYGVELIKSSSWNSLQCLRLTKLMLKTPNKDLAWIFSKCPKDLRVLELVSIPLSGLSDFNTNENGIWLIDLIFKSFPALEHLILADLTLGPPAVSLLMKKLATKKLKSLKVFGFVQIKLIGYNFEQLYQTFTNNYQMSLLLSNERQYQSYCEEYNLFKNGRTFFTLNK